MRTQARTFKALSLLLPLAAAGFLLPSASHAQAPSPDKCAAPVPPAPGQNGSFPNNREDLSRQLDNCNGELKAPPVGDGNMVAPAPDIGNSRVIKPGELPSNGNPSNGSGG